MFAEKKTVSDKNTPTEKSTRATAEEINYRLLYTKIILSQLSQSSDIFRGSGQGLQCVPNSILSLLYHFHKNSELWKLQDIENILRSGNILYNSIGKNTTLLVSDIPKYVKLYDFIYHIQEENSVIGYISKEDINFNAIHFSKVEPIIVTHKYSVLVIDESAVSIIHSNNNFYLFDPHNHNKYGLPDNNGGSVVITFSKFNTLWLHIDKLSQSLNSELYELTLIKITKYRYTESDKNISRDINKAKPKTSPNSTSIINMPAGKNRSNQQHSDKHSEKVKNTQNDSNRNTSILQTASTSKIETKKRKSQNTTLTYKQYKKCKIANDHTKTEEINSSRKRKNQTEIFQRNAKKSKIHDSQKIMKPQHNLKNLKIILPNILIFLHRQNNKHTLTKAKQDNILCKTYGHNMKIPLVYIKDITMKDINKNQRNENMTSVFTTKHGRNLGESIKMFYHLTSHGPIYVCSICQQTNFIDKVTEIAKLKKNKNMNLLNECRTNYKSVNNKEYICHTCKKYIYKGKIPRLSIKNGCGFPKTPNELNLFNLEERFISPVMAFMLIHQLFPGGQFSLYGSICHLPIEIGKVISTLPRSLDQYETIAVKLKRRLSYKNSVFSENVRPQKIIEALQYLLQNSELYQKHNINIEPEWLDKFSNTNNYPPNEDLHDDKSNNSTNSSDDEDNNDQEEPNAPSINTLITENTIDANKDILCIAPAEGQKPIFTDEDTEYLCFPTIFCGQKRQTNTYYQLTKREIFKYEMRSVDKRVSTNIPNIFWKTKFKQINQIHQQVSFALRRTQTKGKTITAEALLDKEQRQNIVKYDDGYRIFKNI